MVRPRVFDDLRTTSVTVDASQLREAREAGINLSELMRSAISSALKHETAGVVKGAPDAERIGEASKRAHAVPERLMAKALICVWENPRVATRWAETLNKRCNAELQPTDLLALAPRF